MSNDFEVSRRTAALCVAGTLATATRPVVAMGLGDPASPRRVGRGLLESDHRRITDLLRHVRLATGASARGKAFERCREALRAHDVLEAYGAASDNIVATSREGSNASLYRYADPSTVLSGVLVRELDAWPTKDAEWLERFSDLEAAFAAHVLAQE